MSTPSTFILAVLAHAFAPAAAVALARPVLCPPAALTPPRDEGELASARRLIEEGSLEKAIALLQARVARHPADVDARLILGTALALVPRRSEALAELQAAVELRPGFAPGHHALGMALLRFVETDRARQAFEKVLALDPRHAPAHVNLGLLLAQAGDRAAAARHLDEAAILLGATPDAAYPHYLRGLLHREMDDPEQAAASFAKAAELRPEDSKAHFQLGLTRRRLLDFDGALAALSKAVQLSPADAAGHRELGRELLRSGDATRAIEHLRIAVAAAPADISALYTLARALRSVGRLDEASVLAAKVADAQRTAALREQNVFKAIEMNDRGIALEKSGEMAAAIEQYVSALELDPLNTVFRRNLGLALCRIGRAKEGIQELQEVLRLDPDDAIASKGLYMAMEMVGRPDPPQPPRNREE